MRKNTHAVARRIGGIVGTALLGLGLTACGPSANEITLSASAGGADPYAFSAIENGDWVTAETQLQTGDVSDPLRLLNLAYVKTAQGDMGGAAEIYRSILEGRDNPYATMGGGQPRRVKRVALEQLLALSDPES